VANVLTRLLPREQSFFKKFTDLTETIQQGAKALAVLFADYDNLATHIQRIKDFEHRGDDLTHEIMTKLNQTFVTPFDREDIHELTTKLDDVIDLIDAVATRLNIYRVAKLRPGAAEMADILVRATAEIHAAVSHLQKQDGIMDHVIEINRLENEGDTAVRSAIARLFDEEKDPFEVIKWKEILEVLETATDKCEDVANVLETIVLKSA
jgi:predicted phosphate transport protein (TIGR00153 family)